MRIRANTAGYGALYVCEVPTVALLSGGSFLRRPGWAEPRAAGRAHPRKKVQAFPARWCRCDPDQPLADLADLADLPSTSWLEAVNRVSRLVRWRRPLADDSRGSGRMRATRARREASSAVGPAGPLSSDGSRASPISQVLGRNGQEPWLVFGRSLISYRASRAKTFDSFRAESPIDVG